MAKDANDSVTLELIPAAKKRGRPASANALTNAQRQRRFRESKKDRVQIELSSDDWARLSAILQMKYQDDRLNNNQSVYSHIVEQVYMAGMKYKNVSMPKWFEENRYKEPVTVTENQPVQEGVTVTEIEAVDNKPVTVTKKPRAKKAFSQAPSRGVESVTVTKSKPRAVITKEKNSEGRAVAVDGVVVGYARRLPCSAHTSWILTFKEPFVFDGVTFKRFYLSQDVRDAAVDAYCRFVPDSSRFTDGSNYI